MSKFRKIISLFLFIIFMGVCAYASWDSGDVNDIVKKTKAGESYNENWIYSDSQLVSFSSAMFTYSIDVKAKLCFVREIGPGANSIIIISYKAIKEGSPLFAPIITWEK